MFISFEGIDGSGKSTQARLLADELRQQGYPVVLVREPGGTPLGESIRELLLAPDNTVDPRTELLLFSAARAQLVSEVIRPALDEGATVIADRYVDSSTAYQGGGRGVGDIEWFHHHHDFVTAGLWPDRTYLLQVDPATASLRREATGKDRMEAGGTLFYNSVAELYRRIASTFPDRVLVLPGDKSVSEIHEAIRADFYARLAVG